MVRGGSFFSNWNRFSWENISWKLCFEPICSLVLRTIFRKKFATYRPHIGEYFYDVFLGKSGKHSRLSCFVLNKSVRNKTGYQVILLSSCFSWFFLVFKFPEEFMMPKPYKKKLKIRLTRDWFTFLIKSLVFDIY